jgi:hypothetical protein
MRREGILTIVTLVLLVAATLLGGCGSGKKEGVEQPLGQAVSVGSESCLNCHTASPDVSGRLIGASWLMTTHTTIDGVQCEDCHGPGSLHWGLGPIPFPNPQPAQCEVCHPDLSTFNATAHNNENQVPNSTFSQFTPRVAPGVTAPNSSQHVQECSVCHNSSQQFSYNTSGVLVNPDPNNLPNPVVTCASCHDPHFAESRQAIPQRPNPVAYPNFRFYFQNMSTAQINSASGATINPRAQVSVNTPLSARQQGFIFQPNGAAIGGTVSGTNNEIKPEILCAACHTKGTYLYSMTATHQTSVYTQWTNSAHGERNDPAWAEFSANPPAYTNPDTGLPYTDTGHQTTYPFDMSLATGNPGNNNYPCFKCHNGVASISYQENVQGTSDADVVWGDATATCITCHDPHANSTGLTSNVHRPVVMTTYTFSSGTPYAGQTFEGNVFLDRNPVPSQALDANSVICIFCHQGRESGYTLFGSRLANNTPAGSNFFNNHYLGTAGMLWGFNAYEFVIAGVPRTYSVNSAHQSTNCAGCHMDKPTSDNMTAGHTWVVNPNNCTTCHSTIANPPVTAQSLADPNGFLSTTRVTSDTNDYTGDTGGSTQPIAVAIWSLEAKLANLLAAQTPPVYYDDTAYPYFFSTADPATHTNANGFKAWTLPVYKAAFNLSYVIKGLPSVGTSTTFISSVPNMPTPLFSTSTPPYELPETSAMFLPNNSAAVHNYKYIIQLLQDSIATLSGQGANVYQPGGLLAGAVRPSTSSDRPATSYNAAGINQPYPSLQ